MLRFLRTALPQLQLLLILLVQIPTTIQARLYGVNYSLRNGPDWDPVETRCKSLTQVTAELQQIQRAVSDRIRVYSMTDCDTAAVVLDVTQQLGMQVWLGIWIGPNGFNFDEERARLMELMALYDFTQNVIGIHVSSEAIYREEITVDQAITFRNTIKADFDAKGWTSIPVTVADIIDTNIEFPSLITVDAAVVTFNQFPFWENTVNISSAATYMSERVALVESQAGGRQIIVTETGWADMGSHPDANVASPASMAKWIQDFICLANERNWGYFWFDSYDNDWRRIQENTPDSPEGHFGIFYKNGTLKPHLAELTSPCLDGDIIPMVPTTTATNATMAPSLAPIQVNTTTPTTEFPTSAPTLAVETTPTSAPTSTIVPTEEPTEISSDEPTTSPSFLPTLSIISETMVPSAFPSDVPSSEPNSAQCNLNPVCIAANLTGECCPTPEGITLLCCGSGVVEEQCENNNRCVEMELTDGTCCPTSHEDVPEIDNKYLDCCGILPDECQIDINSTEAENSKCEFMSTVEYKLLYEQYKQSLANSAAVVATRDPLRITLMLSMVVASFYIVIQ